MAELISLEKMQLNNLNDIQFAITRIIMKSDNFTQIEIFEKIKNFLVSKGIKEEIVNSFKINGMIDDTLDLLVEKGKLNCFNNFYKKDDNYRTEQDITKVLHDKQLIKCYAKSLKRIIDGNPVNKDPLTDMPEFKMRLYGFQDTFFDTEDELIEYVKNHNSTVDNVCVIDFLGDVAGQSDVIRITSKSGKQILYTVVDEDGYGIYNQERSIYKGEYVWEYNYGSISKMYSAFRDRGIIFEDDVYSKIDKRNQKVLKMCRENNLFNCGKKLKLAQYFCYFF